MTSKILLTRPLIQSRLYAGELAALGIGTLVEPMLEFEALDFTVPDLSRYHGVLFTSAHAVKVFTARADFAALSAYCVGSATAQAARDSGLAQVQVYDAEGDAAALVDMVAQHCSKDQKLLHVRGEHVARPLHVLLGGRGYDVDTLMVYKTVQHKKMSAECVRALEVGEVSAVVFFSARTAKAFVEAAQGLDLSMVKALCISSGVVRCAGVLNWREAQVAPTPDRAGMTQLIQEVTK